MFRKQIPITLALASGVFLGLIAATVWSSYQQSVQAEPSASEPTTGQDSPKEKVGVNSFAKNFKGKVGKTLKDSQEYWPQPVEPPKGAPNVLIWLIDDCGYGHTSTFGGLVPTPNIDRVAKKGLTYTNFHTTALCSPTRAAFLAGRNHHSIGLGSHSLTAMGFPGYNAHVPPSARGFARVLQMFGWLTSMIGKWDHTPQWESTVAGPFDRWPTREGFDRFYGFMSADMNNFNPIMWTEHTPVQPGLGKTDYHVIEDMADKAIEFVSMTKAAKAEKPFCMFWATPAVHAPHQAPRDWIEKFRGKFDGGWDQARETILERQIKQCIVPPNTKLAPRDKEIPEWKTLSNEEKKLYARQMEAFAGQLAYSDYQFGRLLDYLERIGELDNTLIIVTSDNGSSGEGGLGGTFNENGFFNGTPNVPLEDNLRFYEQWGNRVGVWHFNAGWAMAGNTPFGWYKQSAFRGGHADPLVISWPKGIQEKHWGEKRKQYHHIIDISPTILQACGVESPKSIDGVLQQPIEGIPMYYTFNDPNAKDRHTTQYFEMFGNRGLYKDGWTAVTQHRDRKPWDTSASKQSFKDDVWHLYHVEKDYSQSTNLAKQYP